MDEKTYTISQVTKQTGLPASTIRYYEKIGLIPPAVRDTFNGRRYYDEQDTANLYQLACLNAAGFSLSEIREYLGIGLENTPEAVEHRLELIRAYRDRTKEQMELLRLREEYAELKMRVIELQLDGDPDELLELTARLETVAENLRVLAHQLGNRTHII
ncbi:MAG: MerR family transcriptional regulator [Corynebacterium sp.]|nr:MerR family transcriptional regulator [Corynebacterium sp.]